VWGQEPTNECWKTANVTTVNAKVQTVRRGFCSGEPLTLPWVSALNPVAQLNSVAFLCYTKFHDRKLQARDQSRNFMETLKPCVGWRFYGYNRRDGP
jgi:hypothetical protein